MPWHAVRSTLVLCTSSATSPQALQRRNHPPRLCKMATYERRPAIVVARGGARCCRALSASSGDRALPPPDAQGSEPCAEGPHKACLFLAPRLRTTLCRPCQFAIRPVDFARTSLSTSSHPCCPPTPPGGPQPPTPPGGGTHLHNFLAVHKMSLPSTACHGNSRHASYSWPCPQPNLSPRH